jgi:hypothetical protein
MAETIQTDYRKLAAEQFPGFTIHGDGAFACFYGGNCVRLFEFELLARATGRHVTEIKPPVRRHFVRKEIRD